MKPRIILTLVLSTLPLSTAFSQIYEPGQARPQIATAASAEVKVIPDEIRVRAGVETSHESITEAKRLNDERITKVLAFIRTSGVKDKDVQTDFISVVPHDREHYQDDPHTLIRTRTYEVRKSIEIRFTKMQGFDAFLTGLLTNGVTIVHGVDFRTTQLRKHRDAARTMAVRAAKEKADAMAAELGVKCGKPLYISANDWSDWSGSSATSWEGRSQSGGQGGGQNSAQNPEGAPTENENTLSIGLIRVSASVSATFLIE